MVAKSVTSTEFRNRAGLYLDEAAKAPVTITKHGRPTRVLIDFEEYARLKSYDTREYVTPAELTADELLSLETARVDPKHDHLNKLLD